MDDISNEVKNAKEEAKKRLFGFIRENQIGYEGYLIEEMKKILKEKGIDWKPDDGSSSID